MKEKLREYADLKNISHRKFSLALGKSDKFIDTKGSLNSEIIPIIRKKFPDLNMNYLLFDEGEIITPDINLIKEVNKAEEKNYKEMCFELLEENRSLNNEIRKGNNQKLENFKNYVNKVFARIGKKREDINLQEIKKEFFADQEAKTAS